MSGRPRKPDGDVKRIPLGMRTTPEVRARLDAAARASGRSLAQEVEFIIERHFDREAMLDDIRRVLREERTGGPAAPLAGDSFGSSISHTNY